MSRRISYRNTNKAAVTAAQLSDVFMDIKSGKVRNIIEIHRENIKYGISEKDKLPMFYTVEFNGESPSKHQIKTNTGIMIFDIDGLPTEKVDEYIHKIKERFERCLYFIFRSPSNDGVKFGLATDYTGTNYWEHEVIYKDLLERMAKVGLCNLDSTIDISRGCYVSWDPDIYVNEFCDRLAVSELASGAQEPIKSAVMMKTTMSKIGKETFNKRMVNTLHSKMSTKNKLFTFILDIRRCGGNLENALMFCDKLRLKGFMPWRYRSEQALIEYVKYTWERVSALQINDPLSIFCSMPEKEYKDFKKAKIDAIRASIKKRLA